MKNLESKSALSHIPLKTIEELRGYATSFEVRPWGFGDSVPEETVRRLEMLTFDISDDEKLRWAGTIRGEFETRNGEVQPFDVFIAEQASENQVTHVYFLEMTPGANETLLAGDVTVEIMSTGPRKKTARVFWTHTIRASAGNGIGTHGIIVAGEYMLRQHKLPLEAGDIAHHGAITHVWEHLVNAGLAKKDPYRYVGFSSPSPGSR